MLPGLPSFQPITRREKNLGKGRQTGEGKAYSEIVARVHPLAGHTTAYDESPVEGYEKGNQHGDYWRSSSIQEKKKTDIHKSSSQVFISRYAGSFCFAMGMGQGESLPPTVQYRLQG